MKHYTSFAQAVTDAFVMLRVMTPEQARDLHTVYQNAQEESFEVFLLEQNLVSKKDLLSALALIYDVPALDVMGEFFDHRLVRMFPKDLMLRNTFIPYEHDGEVMIIIAAEPDNETLLTLIGNHVSYDIVFMVGLARDIDDMVKEFYDESLTPFQPDDDYFGSDELTQEKEVEELIDQHGMPKNEND